MTRQKTGTRRKISERADVMAMIEDRGIRAATEACIAVCEDKAAPAPARATAAGLLFRASALGGFGKNFAPDPFTKEPHEMTPDERAAALQQLDEWEASMRAGGDDEEDDGSAFD